MNGRLSAREERLTCGEYTDQDGIERNTVDIVTEQMQMLQPVFDEGDDEITALASGGTSGLESSE